MTGPDGAASAFPTVIDLSLGEPAHAPPDRARQAALESIETTNGGYLPQAGDPQLRAAAAEALTRANGILAKPEEVIITTGASLGIFATLATLCRPHDAVLLPDPGFPLYQLIAETQGLTPLRYKLRAGEGFEPDWEAIAALAGRSRVLLWNFPSNPAGTVARPAWLNKLFEIVAQHPQLYVVSDEVYADLVYEGVHASPAAHAGAAADRIVSVFSFSKSYAMTGYRVGYLHAASELAASIARVHWAASMSTPTASQSAALAALEEPREYLRGVRGRLILSRDEALKRTQSVGLRSATPEGGLFLWLDVSQTQLDSRTFVRQAADRCKVVLSPGVQFGADDHHIRLSFAGDRQRLREALGRLAGWIGASASGPVVRADERSDA